MRRRCATAIPPLVEAIESVRRPRYLTFEEGPPADWLYRNLLPHIDEVLVCEPRRNSYIAKDSDKDDPIDADSFYIAVGRPTSVNEPATTISYAPISSWTS